MILWSAWDCIHLGGPAAHALHGGFRERSERSWGASLGVAGGVTAPVANVTGGYSAESTLAARTQPRGRVRASPKSPRNMPPKDRNWHTERRRLRVFDRLRTNPAGKCMFGAAANGTWSGCWAQTSRFGASRFVPKIAKNGRIFEKNPRRPYPCSPTCPDPGRRKR